MANKNATPTDWGTPNKELNILEIARLPAKPCSYT